MTSPMKILVVDDDEKIGKLFVDVFGSDGHTVNAVTSGEDAVKAYKEYPHNLVFLDMILPKMNGLETLKELKKIDSNVRVVLITGYSVLGMLEDASRIGVITTLIKPFHIDQIKEVVDNSGDVPVLSAEEKKGYSALIIDEWMGLKGKLEGLFEELNFEIESCKDVNEVNEQMKQKEFDLILISTSALKQNTMKTFYYMKETMPVSKCVILVDEYMDMDEVSNNIREMFREN